MVLDEFYRKIIAWMEEHTGQKYEVKNVIKNNGEKLPGLVKAPVAGQSSNPVIYLNEFYQEVMNGKMSFPAAAGRIENLYTEAEKQACSINGREIVDFSKIKDMVFLKLINGERNTEYLKDAPHRTVAGNLSVSYRLLVENGSDSYSSALIKNDLIKEWGIKEEELYSIAMENTQRLFPRKIQTLRDIISENMPEGMGMADEFPTDGPQMYVITNDRGINGATALLYPDSDEAIRKLTGEDVYILPSSVHEWILLPKRMMTREEALDMVQYANETAVEPEDYLSSDIYEIYGSDLINAREFNLEDFMEPPDNEMEPEL